jgi:hypothetical protein
MIKTTFTLLGLLSLTIIYGQNKNTISGYVYDQKTGESLIGVNVVDETSREGTTTNDYGFYSLTLPSGKKKIAFSFLGYQKTVRDIELNKNTTLNIRLSDADQELETVVITAEAQKEKERVASTDLGKVDMPMTLLRKAPVLLGESDVLKVLQLMPGIKRGSEGQIGLFVRGGGSDENLILLDEAPVYNAGHLLGFFSVFNSNSLKDVSMYKAAFPAFYGGRLSSILDIKMKEGNDQRFATQGSLGLISSNLTVEGPLVKNKGSFIVSGRRTYIDKVFQAVGQQLPYYFYDLNAKLNYKISEKDRVYLSSYFGRDVLYAPEIENDGSDTSATNFDTDFTTFLGNFTISGRWNHSYPSGKLFHNLTVLTSQFRYNINGSFAANSLKIESNINDIGVKLDYDYRPSSTATIKYGAAITNHDFRPNVISIQGEIGAFLKERPVNLIRNKEVAAYGSYDWDINERLKLTAGLRLSGSFVQGEAYGGLEPRLAMRYNLAKETSVKLGYARMKQYLHLIGSSAIALPTDLWYPSTKNVKPGKSDQISTGIFHYFEKIRTNVSIEGYYKWLDNLIEYREGAVLILNDNYEQELVTGKGWAYGAEFLAQKSHGKWTGWIGYTYSIAKRQFDELNKGQSYYSKFDRRHDFSIVSMLDLTKRISFSFSWVYSSGSPFTPSVAQYFMPNSTFTKIDILPVYTPRNDVRLSAAHRLDFDITLKGRKRKRWEGEWHLGAYNTYARTQPNRIAIELNPETQKLEYVQRGLFGFVGSVSYNFKF